MRSRRAPTGATAANGQEQARSLEDVLTSLLAAAIAAKRSMDETSAGLAKTYWSDPVLRTLPLPSFTMPELRMQLKFAVAALEVPTERRVRRAAAGPAHMQVIVDAAALAKLPAHLVSEMELRVTPQLLRIFESEQEPDVDDVGE